MAARFSVFLWAERRVPALTARGNDPLAVRTRTSYDKGVRHRSGPAMRKTMTATELRKDIYRVLDDVLETGIPQEVSRGSRTLMIVPAGGKRLRLDSLP